MNKTLEVNEILNINSFSAFYLANTELVTCINLFQYFIQLVCGSN